MSGITPTGPYKPDRSEYLAADTPNQLSKISTDIVPKDESTSKVTIRKYGIGASTEAEINRKPKEITIKIPFKKFRRVIDINIKSVNKDTVEVTILKDKNRVATVEGPIIISENGDKITIEDKKRNRIIQLIKKGEQITLKNNFWEKKTQVTFGPIEPKK
ncbi:MAG: hypothetical protein ABIH00_11110 [Armatimonadota bacterium]